MGKVQNCKSDKSSLANNREIKNTFLGKLKKNIKNLK